LEKFIEFFGLGTSPQDIYALLDDIPSHYHTFYIAKKNGKKRKIEAPDDTLKVIQKLISIKLSKLHEKKTRSKRAVGFRKYINAKDGALRHVNMKEVLTMDIKNFFPSITSKNLKLALETFFATDKVCQEFIPSLISLCTLNGHLPQGAPTSPVLSNIFLKKFDTAMLVITKNHKIEYTRYADDLTFSGGKFKTKSQIAKAMDNRKKNGIPEPEPPKPITWLIPIVKSKLVELGLIIHPVKTRIKRANRRQVVTGIVVNKRINIDKTTRRALRAQLHNMKTSGHVLAEHEYLSLRGKIAWIWSLNRLHATNLEKQLIDLSREESAYNGLITTSNTLL